MNITNPGDGAAAGNDDASLEKPSWRAAAAGRRRKPAKARTGKSWKATATDWYQKYLVEMILRRKALPPSKDGRHIPLSLSHDKPLVDERRGHAYVSNTIRTSRYTVYDFFPKQLFFQFTRLGNFYFLCVGIPQTIPGLSTTGNYTTILPLLFFVLLTVAKEGYDDWKRHRLDKVENARTAAVLRKASGGCKQAGRSWFGFGSPPTLEVLDSSEAAETGYHWIETQWKDLKVGDVVKLKRDEDVPADIVLLQANGENGMAYIETMALDGETNLKSKQVPSVLEGCDTIQGLSKCDAEFVVEDPNPDLFRFDGRVTAAGKTRPLTLNEVVYRGCTLRNTPHATGLVINTGEECKIRRNANRHPTAKKPALEKIANKIVLSLAFFVVCLSVGCSMGYLLWQSQYEQMAWYLDNARVPFQEIFIGFAIQFNNVIPLALYVSLEIVKLGQMWMLNSDIRMYDEESDTPARCNTNTILENLGQIGYIFSDKTGTLTENVMKFRKLSIAGTSWLHEVDITKEGSMEGIPEVTHERAKNPRRSLAAAREAIETEVSGASAGRPSIVISARPTTPAAMVRRSSSHWRSTGRPDHVQPDLNTEDLLEYLRLRPHSEFSRRATLYILAMALCHTCLPEVKDDQIEFQAASPDELALVKAAQELGFLVIQRSSQAVTLRITQGDTVVEKVYEILDVIEFSSKRKRMSIVVRCPDGRIWLLTKGADSVILPRLRMAHLALRKANEVRKSVDLEHELQRKSEAREPRNSFGGRPSLTIKRSIRRQGSSTGLSTRPTAPNRSHSFEASTKLSMSEDRWQPPKLGLRTVSFDQRPRASLASPLSPLTPQSPIDDKFSFLEDQAVSDDSEIFTRCFKHIDDFATEGLRTLLFAHKYLTEQEYQTWKKLYHDAETSLVDRQERMEATGDLIEQSLELVGASAIEDKLQKGVPETIDRLRRANIKIWMLTGDKRETAINIAHSARICRPGSDIFILDVSKGDLEGQLLNVQDELQVHAETQTSPVPSHIVVVIDGHTLAAIEKPDASTLRQLFYSLIPNIDSVICCRASPAQKALIVQAIRKSPNAGTASLRAGPGCMPASHTSPLTLAIGDGANDLAMLSAAHVGVGISGREGLQAARVADYSIAQFRFLSRLLLVHGRWNYVRTARFILATFWKEMFFYLPTELYQRYNGYTGTSLYESWSLTVLNTLFTSLCTVIPGIWEQDLKAETLLAVPELYVFGQRDQGLNFRRYLLWMFGGVSEGLLVWFVCWASYGGMSLMVKDNGLFALGNLVFSVGIMWTNWKLLLLDTHHRTWIVIFSYSVTTAGWWAWQGFLSGIYAPGITPYAVKNGLALTFGQDPIWWLTLVVTLAMLATIEMAYRAVKRNLVVMGLWTFGWKWFKSSTWREAIRTPRNGMWPALERDGNRDRSSVEEWDVELWQEMEQDAQVREMLHKMSGEYEDVDEVGDENEVRTRNDGEEGRIDVERTAGGAPRRSMAA